MTFYGECRADHHTQEHLHESPPVMTVSADHPRRLWRWSAGFWACRHSLGGRRNALRATGWRRCSAHGARSAARARRARRRADAEFVLMAVSVAVALGGFLLARAMYLTKTVSPDALRRAGRRRARTALVLQQVLRRRALRARVRQRHAAADALPRLVRQHVIDGIVNGAASVPCASSRGSTACSTPTSSTARSTASPTSRMVRRRPCPPPADRQHQRLPLRRSCVGRAVVRDVCHVRGRGPASLDDGDRDRDGSHGLLTYMTFIPLLGAVVVLCLPSRRARTLIRWTAVALTVPPLLLAIWLFVNFDRRHGGLPVRRARRRGSRASTSSTSSASTASASRWCC